MSRISKYIDADALIMHLSDYALTESPNDNDSSFDKLIHKTTYNAINECIKAVEEMPAAEAGYWIPVDERLPENAKDRDAFRPKYQIYTSFGITEGCYGWSGNTSGWYALIWFMDGRYEEWNIDLERGDIPKVVFIPNGGKVKVYAWREFPEPPKMDGGNEE